MDEEDHSATDASVAVTGGPELMYHSFHSVVHAIKGVDPDASVEHIKAICLYRNAFETEIHYGDVVVVPLALPI